MGAPIVYSGSYVGTGATKFIRVPFKLSDRYWIIVKGDTTQNACWTSSACWYKRTQHIAAISSEFDEIGGVTQNGFYVRTDAVTNSAGVTYYYLVIDDNQSDTIIPFSWMGNAISGRTIQTPLTSRPVFGLFKRDANQLALQYARHLTRGVAEGGTDDTEGVLGWNDAGVLTVGSSARINELSTPLGEACDCVLFGDNANIYVTSYTGSGAGRTISTPFTPEACWIFPNETLTGATGTQMAISALASDTLPWANVAKQSGRITALSASGVTLGTAGSVNESAKSYTLVALKGNTTNAARFPRMSASRKGIYLHTANTSMIECGASDTLKFDGAMSIEWYGKIPGVTGATPAASAAPVPLLMRTYNGSGGAASQGSTSWGISGCLHSDYHAAGGFGIGLRVVITNWHDIAYTDTDIRTQLWNTGVVIPHNRNTHVLVTHNGTGRWRIFLDGNFVKERNLDMTTINAAYPNIASGTGHKTGIDVRYAANGTSSVGKFKLFFYYGAVWNSELTIQQARDCWLARTLNYSISTPTPLEYWDATDATGTTLPAGINAVNDGTITSGRIYDR